MIQDDDNAGTNSHLRPLLRAPGKRVPDTPLLGPLRGSLDELVVDALLDHQPGARTAALALVEEESEVRHLHGLVKVGVVQDDERRLAAQLQGDLLEVGPAGRLLDQVTHLSGPREGDLVDGHVLGDGSPSGWSVARDDVDHARGETLQR